MSVVDEADPQSVGHCLNCGPIDARAPSNWHTLFFHQIKPLATPKHPKDVRDASKRRGGQKEISAPILVQVSQASKHANELGAEGAIHPHQHLTSMWPL
jgi:hypothetical protein